MSQNFRGLSEEEQNDCRVALQRFVEKHDLFEWGITLKVQDTTSGRHSVKIEIMPPPALRLTPLLPF